MHEDKPIKKNEFSDRKLYIKNMVCDRCILVVGNLLHQLGLKAESIELGIVVLSAPLSQEKRCSLKKKLESYGFDLLGDKNSQLVEEIKIAIIQLIHYTESDKKVNLSEYLSQQCGHDYSYLSKLFSERNGITIEKYYLAQKIERIKELLLYDELSISEIAYKLNYSSVAHLSRQFRLLTGLSPSQFKKERRGGLSPLDKV